MTPNRSNTRTNTWYVEPWQRAELPDDADRRRYRREKAKAAKRHAKQLAPILAAAKAELERQLNAGLITTRGGKKTRSAHLTHLAVEAADQ